MIDKINKIITSKMVMVCGIILMAFWGTSLLQTDAFYVNYLLIICLASACIYYNYKNGELTKIHTGFDALLVRIFALAFTIMVAASNYIMWAIVIGYSIENGMDYIPYQYDIPSIHFFLKLLIFFGGGYYAFWNILNAVKTKLDSLNYERTEHNLDPKKVFIISFVVLLVTRLFVLFVCQYPGEVTPDSVMQVDQIMKGEYTNHHPFYHTMVINACMSLGMLIFNNINAGVATYSVFQILFTSLCFSYLLSTIATLKPPKWILILSILFFVLMPYHIIYPMTMWKDIMYACFVLFSVIAIFRCINNIGKTSTNHIVIVIGSIGSCLFRSNGLFTFVLTTISFYLLWKSKYKKILILMLSSIAVGLVMKYGVLKILNVPQPDIVESLSVPLQQVARVVHDVPEIDQEERDELSDLLDYDHGFYMYMSHISDPIKSAVRDKGGIKKLLEDPGKYIKLYFTLGLKYPASYVLAWIDLTKGYWNAGYEYYRWRLEVYSNDHGMEKLVLNENLNNAFLMYVWMFSNVHLLKLFLSIGLFVWINLVLLLIAILKKDKMGIFMTLPVIAIVISLLITTPVYAEFRYIYTAFCILPFTCAVVFRPIENK